jgi:hypothetical protein
MRPGRSKDVLRMLKRTVDAGRNAQAGYALQEPTLPRYACAADGLPARPTSSIAAACTKRSMAETVAAGVSIIG